jgi:flagellar hook-associated protein 2
MTTSTSLNFNNVNVNSSGQITFSGVGSGIDFQKIENAIIQAKQVPIDNLKTTITDDQKKITDLQKFQSLLTTLQSSVSTLYGAVSFDNSSNDFLKTVASTGSTRTDGATPSAAANILAVTTSNEAQAGDHQIQVLQVATAEKLGSGSFNSLTTDLGTASGGAANSISGSFTINGVSISVLSTDHLTDLRDRINAADTGTSATGVKASIVSVSSTQNILVLTADQTGTPITLADPGSTGVLAQLGISNDGGTTPLNLLQASQNAQFYADGLTDPSKFQTAIETSHSAAFSSYTSISASSNSFQILDANGALLGTVTYDNTDSLDSIATKVSAISGVTGTVVADGSGYRLAITSDAGTRISVTNDTGTLVSELGIANQPLLLTRSSNTISDLYAGVTVNLFQAEKGTTVNISLTQDVAGVKTDIQAFVQAYNAVRQFVNTENQTDPTTGGPSANAGPLFGDNTMNQIRDLMSGIIGAGAQGTSAEFTALSQIGVNFVDNTTLTDPTLNDTLTIDDGTLNQALLNNASDVQKLFAFNFSSSDPTVTLLGFDGSASYNSSGYTINLAFDSGTGALTSANINGPADGSDDGSATVNGQSITATSQTGASGLQLYYSGNTNLSGTTLNFTVGFASQLFFLLKSATDSTSGMIQNEIDGIQTKDTATQATIDQQTNLLATYQQSLTDKFNKAETTISNLNDVQASVLQLLNGGNSNSSSG